MFDIPSEVPAVCSLCFARIYVPNIPGGSCAEWLCGDCQERPDLVTAKYEKACLIEKIKEDAFEQARLYVKKGGDRG